MTAKTEVERLRSEVADLQLRLARLEGRVADLEGGAAPAFRVFKDPPECPGCGRGGSWGPCLRQLCPLRPKALADAPSSTIA
jgi:hypothetical protein